MGMAGIAGRRSRHARWLGAMTWVALASASAAHAELKSIGVAALYGAPMGRFYQTYKPGAGGYVELVLDFPSLLGSDWMAHLSADYSAHTLRSSNDLRLGKFNIFVGLESRMAAPEAPILPFIALDLGATYMGMTATGGGATAQNGATNFSIRWRPGFELPVSGSLSAVFSVPITVVFKESYADWAALVGVRWGL